MGDARAEHLLLAAKKVRSMRSKDSTVGRLTLAELQQHGVIGPDGGLGYQEGYRKNDDDEPLEADEDDKRLVLASPAPDRNSAARAASGTPLLPRARKPAKRLAPTTPSRSRGAPQVPQTTPGGSNFNDLLLAAEMATRPGTPTRDPRPSGVMSATRSTTTRPSQSTYDSPSKKRRHEPPATIEWSTRRHLNDRDDDGSPGTSASALDLLAQASQDVAQGAGPMPSASRFEGMMDSEQGGKSQSSRSQTPLGPAINLKDARARSNSNASHTPGRAFGSGDDPFNEPSTNSGTFQSPSGAAVPGLGKYVHLSSTMPARRVRSPYLKWTKEEVSRVCCHHCLLTFIGRASHARGYGTRREVGHGQQMCAHPKLSPSPPAVSLDLEMLILVPPHRY